MGVIGALLGSQDMHHACSGVWLALTALTTNDRICRDQDWLLRVWLWWVGWCVACCLRITQWTRASSICDL